MDVMKDVAWTVVAMLGAAALVRFFLVLGELGAIDMRVSRKLVHILGGLLFMLMWPLYSAASSAAVLAAAVPLVNAARLLATGCGWLHDPDLVASACRSGRSQELLQVRGPVAYVLVMTVVVLLGWREHPAGVAAVAMMCAGDGLADLAGSRWGKRWPLPWNKDKSWPGSAAMLLGAWLSAVGMLVYFMHMGCMMPLQALGLGALALRVGAIAAACTLIESLPTSLLDDNITVPATAVVSGAVLLPGIWPAAAHLEAIRQAMRAAAAAAVGAAQPGLMMGAAVNSCLLFVGLQLLQKKLSNKAIALAWLLGTAVYGVFGAGRYVLMGASCLAVAAVGVTSARIK